MRILISGSSGWVGSELVPFLRAGEHSVTRLVRRPAHAGGKEIAWEPAEAKLDAAALEGFDAVVHLAGANLAAHRWTAAFKAQILESRAQGTRLLAAALAQLTQPPKVLVSASAVGFYGDCGDATLTEENPKGKGFLAEVCRVWETSTEPAARKGIRVVNLRMGVVLGRAGGALKKMLLPFQLGLGGVIGSGRQYMSWIALDDLLAVIVFAMTHDALRGAVNATAPHPVTNREFTKTLGSVLGRPTIFPMPAFVARLAFGEMADEMLLSSARVMPAKLLAAGFAFQFPTLNAALRQALGKRVQ
jgi:uncharacterized protein (TIGR01777 family)